MGQTARFTNGKKVGGASVSCPVPKWSRHFRLQPILRQLLRVTAALILIYFFMYKLDAPGVGGLGAGGEDASNLIIGTKDFLSPVI